MTLKEKNVISDIQANLQYVLSSIPKEVRLVAVSKFHPEEAINEAYESGQRIFGESKVQEMTRKHEVLPQDIEWHFIGHLQTNKVKYIAPYVSLIHSIDSFKLLSEINRQGEKNGRIICGLLQMHVAREETKFGFSLDECRQMLAAEEWKKLTHVRICGIMGMASNTDNENQVREEFKTLHDFFLEIQQKHFSTDESFKELSMGMSHDYPWAIEEGATLIRVGSLIFGDRIY